MAPLLAFQFPGQGSQHVGMGRAARDAFAEAREAYQEADDALGIDLSGLCFEGDEAELARTENTQPAILSTSVALHRVLQAGGVTPVCVAGHSLGQYSALVAAGSLSLTEAVRLVRDRGRYMQEAVPEGEGAMAAVIGLDDEQVRAACREAAEATGVAVEPANYNSPGQVVIAGARAGVEEASERAKAAGARRALLLNVSAPFHCSLMLPAQVRLAERLQEVEIAAPRIPVVCNVEATILRDGEEVRGSLERQVTAPVRWVDNVRRMAESGADALAEVGPGKVLTGLARRILERPTTHSVQGPEDVEALLAALRA